MYTQGQMIQPAGVMSTAPRIVPPLSQQATQAQQGYSGAIQNNALAQALLKAKLAKLGGIPRTAAQMPALPAAAAPDYFSPAAAASTVGAAPFASQ